MSVLLRCTIGGGLTQFKPEFDSISPIVVSLALRQNRCVYAGW
jgi:hypothetical protein